MWSLSATMGAKYEEVEGGCVAFVGSKQKRMVIDKLFALSVAVK